MNIKKQLNIASHPMDDMRRSQTVHFDAFSMLGKIDNARTMPPSIGKLANPFGIGKQDEVDEIKRQSSLLSFHGLSVSGDCQSVTDSQMSHYQPSINEPFIMDDASPEEKAMHAFLDQVGVYQVNVKQQFDTEKKSACSASPSLKQRLSFIKTKQSPSFMERRQRRLLSKNESTAASSSGTQSQQVNLANGPSLPSFTSDLFKIGALPKSVTEEPNSANSTGDMKQQVRTQPSGSTQVNTKSPVDLTPPTIIIQKTSMPIGMAKLGLGQNTSDQDYNSECLAVPGLSTSARHQSLTPPSVVKNLSIKHPEDKISETSDIQQDSLLSRVSNTSNIDRSSLSSFTIKVQKTPGEQEDHELMRKQSGPPQLGSRLGNIMHLCIQTPSFSVGCASDEPHSAVSFSDNPLGGSPGYQAQDEEEKPENQTPTLPTHWKDHDDENQRFYADLEHELLDDQSPLHFKKSATAVGSKQAMEPQFCSPEVLRSEGRVNHNLAAQEIKYTNQSELVNALETPNTPFFKQDTPSTPFLNHSGSVSFKLSPDKICEFIQENSAEKE